MPNVRMKQIFLVGTFLATLASPAFAFDSQDMLSKFKAASEKQDGFTFTYGDVVKNGDDGLTLKDFTYVGMPSTQGESKTVQKQPITLTLEDIKENDDGSYLIGEASDGSVTYSIDNFDLKMGSSVASNLYIPAVSDFSKTSGLMTTENFTVDNISVNYKGDNVLNINNYNESQTVNKNGINSLMTLSGITLDLSNVEDIDAETRDTLDKLDLLKTTASMSFNGDWNLATGDVKIASYNLAVKDVGTLDLSMDLTGITHELLTSLQNKTETPTPKASDDDDKTDPYQAELMQLGQAIGVSHLKVSFDDASITERVLALQGEKNGLTATEQTAKIEADLAKTLATLNVSSLSTMANKAFSAYIANPQNFTVSIEPQMQMPILAVIMAGAAAPKAIPQMLNLKITANE